MTKGLSPLRDRLRRAAQALGLPIDVVEFDYGLSYVLAAIYAHQDLHESFVFKGGTALAKAHVAGYRFSRDLDFTAVGGPRGDELERTMEIVAHDAEEMLSEHGPFVVTSTRRTERGAHPSDQEAFVVLVRFPWHRSVLRGVKVEVTVDEPLALSAQTLPLLHPYGEALATDLRVYRLEEIVAEKLRTPLQAQKRVEGGSWARNCARDYYDLWFLLRLEEGFVDLRAVRGILPQKCAVRDVVFTGVDDFFPPLIVSEAKRQWETSLADLVTPLPSFDDAIEGVREAVSALLG